MLAFLPSWFHTAKSQRRRVRFRSFLSAPLVTIHLCTGAFAASDERCETVGNDWRWFSDHFAASITYVTQAAPGRRYEIGTGVSFGGRPRGRVQEVEGKVEVTAYGLGALHMRFVDGHGPGTICAAQGSIRVVSFPSIEF